MRYSYKVPAEDHSGWSVKTEKGNFDVTYITRTEIASEKDVRAFHCHNDITEIALVYSGKGTSVIGNKEYQIETGDVIVYNKDVLHCDKNEEGMVLKFHLCGVKNLHMKGRTPGKVLNESTGYVIRSGRYFEYLLHGFEMLEESISSGQSDVAQLTKMFVGTFLRIIDILCEEGKEEMNTSGTYSRSQLVSAMRKYIDKHYHENFLLNDLTEKFNVNMYHASRLFTKEMGVSPIAYRTRQRIGIAQTLLTDTDNSISEIANMVGYNYLSRFTHQFVNIIGISPREYRETRVQMNKSLHQLQEE
ncbi:AraC family transcriptional regulator [Ruminococcus gauvreauii]|uniref:AraC family transcriptional regulator n=1 Tax=Ruminococcus gauvreauii TaxID=438033 RepID=A0ABY5VLH1_9FIRM|nr:AraC family transcriptional regulator [Ruminococcus gauvreauii]UWP61046.1 AraC family transcriptional regulator [Ruminococcus gauvreauii]